MWESQTWISEEMAAFEEYARGKFADNRTPCREMASRLILSKGKRLRPALTILSAKSGEYDRARTFPAALAIEALHAATLAHDDLIDGAATRRGQQTISSSHGASMAVYVGDYLFAKSLLLMAESGLEAERTEWVARSVLSMCEGEVAQYLGRYELTSVSQYLRRIARKTGILFAAACVIGGKSGSVVDKDLSILRRFGFRFGMAFQIRDDLMDIEADYCAAGKPVVRDLKDGIATLPILLAIRKDAKLEAAVRDCFQNKEKEVTYDFVEAVKLADGNKAAKQMLTRYADKCSTILNGMPRNITRNALEELIEWITL